MNFSGSYILNFSIVVCAVIGWMRLNRIHSSYYPFLYLMWSGTLKVVISTSLVLLGYYNVISINIYHLLESLLIFWLFYCWRLFDERPKLYYISLAVFSAIWLLDNIFISGFFHFNSYFRMSYSFAIVLMSITMINRLLFRERISLLRNPAFLICSGFIVFYTLTVLAEAFFVCGLTISPALQAKVNYILNFTHLFCNLLYAFAILWMPRRQAFSLQY